MTKLIKNMNSREFLALFEREGEPRLSMYRGHVEYYGDLRVREARERIKAAIVKEFTCICDKAWQVRGSRPDPRCHFCNAVRYCIEIVDESEGTAKESEVQGEWRATDMEEWFNGECFLHGREYEVPPDATPVERRARGLMPEPIEMRRAYRYECAECRGEALARARAQGTDKTRAELHEVQSLIHRQEPKGYPYQRSGIFATPYREPWGKPKAHTMNCAVSQSRACDCGAMP